MLATAGPLPEGAQWAYEVKWDGVRVLADVGRSAERSDADVRLWSRAGNDVTAGYPELAGLAGEVEDALLDGEVVALDGSGRPSFGLLQERMHVRDPARVAGLVGEVPVTYLVFDVLRAYGVDLTGQPWSQRRGVLERMQLAGPSWATPDAFDDGAATLAASRATGLEGVVAKRRTSRYLPGLRSPDWVKVAHRSTQECLVGGWRPGEGHRAALGALLVGVLDKAGTLRYAGRVGSGLTERSLADLVRRLPRLVRAAPPFADPVPALDAAGARWVAPRLVVDVEHLGWTRAGRLRAPVYKGLRPDKLPAEAVREAVIGGNEGG
jgi:bifunctional non-homologous end joining protein LigD